MPAQPVLIGVDWGTTACRAYLIGANGAVLDRVVDGPGILRIESRAFGAALRAMIGGWAIAHGPLPILLSGMIGSRQGWIEAPYVPCPAGSHDLVRALAWADEAGLGRIAIVPGLTVERDLMPDVMRGEETQVLGALGPAADGQFVLPGTHAKWVEAAGGRIVSFRTFMTGEAYAALKDHTILGRLMQPGEPDAGAFARGVEEGAALGSAGALLNRLFAVRTYGLLDRLPATALADYLSGLLVGAEIAEATAALDRPVTIIASPTLAARYAEALRLVGRPGIVAGDDCAALGQWRIAGAAGLVKGEN